MLVRVGMYFNVRQRRTGSLVVCGSALVTLCSGTQPGVIVLTLEAYRALVWLFNLQGNMAFGAGVDKLRMGIRRGMDGFERALYPN